MSFGVVGLFSLSPPEDPREVRNRSSLMVLPPFFNFLGDPKIVKMPKNPEPSCVVDGSSGAWKYTVAFTECNIAPPSGPSLVPDSAGLYWYTYSIYLNYDNVVDPIFGTGNIQQLSQTLLQCRVPANIKENSVVAVKGKKGKSPKLDVVKDGNRNRKQRNNAQTVSISFFILILIHAL